MNSKSHGDMPCASNDPWRVSEGRVVLQAYRHEGRDELFFPPLPQTSPQRTRTETVDLHGMPTLYSYTVMHPSPKTGKPPVALGYADYPEGVRIFGRLLYPQGQRPAIGDALAPCLIDTEEGTVYAFALQNKEPR
ncbi:OB-fold domain-containing protein [Paraburkholderia sp. Ac-20340]|uniref:Zn-ribbon domain-containing OB-fold protein n=1 Tax=Paraburkholderia sp. Ac-20340 TaxID=2703888 RepID=UPI001F122307|nr:OB-fold domain-containing protein [Paraburkholderia sp. Ac-20340]